MALPTAPGLYDFLDAVGGPAQLLHVRDADGVLMARFPALGDDEVRLTDLIGEFRPCSRPATRLPATLQSGAG